MYSLILLNGGVGSRLGASEPKQFIKINGIPMLIYSLIAVDSIDEVNEIVLNYPSGAREKTSRLIESYAIKTPVILVEAGENRHESVFKMLEHTKNKNIIIHEAARPLVEQIDFERLIKHKKQNISYMLPIPFTVAPVNPDTNKVLGYIEREGLRNVQLPQKFIKEHLVKAHNIAKESSSFFTEDATLLANYNFDVYFEIGSEKNFKITTSFDMEMAEKTLLKRNINE